MLKILPTWIFCPLIYRTINYSFSVDVFHSLSTLKGNTSIGPDGHIRFVSLQLDIRYLFLFGSFLNVHYLTVYSMIIGNLVIGIFTV